MPSRKKAREIERSRCDPGERRGDDAEHERAEDLAEHQRGVVGLAQLAGGDHQQGVEHAAGERDQGGQGQGGRRRPQGDQNADEADADGE